MFDIQRAVLKYLLIDQSLFKVLRVSEAFLAHSVHRTLSLVWPKLNGLGSFLMKKICRVAPYQGI